MGWTYLHKPRGMPVGRFLTECCEIETVSGSAIRRRVLDSATVNLSECYMAVETLNEITCERHVVAVVFLVQFRHGDQQYNFGYKEMDETMAPYYYRCPERILRQLTPTLSESAVRWRAKCWERLNAVSPQLH